MSVAELNRDWTREDAWAAMAQLLNAARRLKMMPAEVLHGTVLSTQETGPMDAHRLADAVAFDLRMVQAILETYRASRSEP